MPMENSGNMLLMLLGVLQLINPRDVDTGVASEFTEDDQKLAVHFAGMAASAIERSSMTRALVLRMMRLAELRDPKETGAHVQRVSQVATRLYVSWATTRGMPEAQMFKQLDQLRPAAILHDVGKVAIPDAVLRKPGPLDPPERRVMDNHVGRGVELVDHFGHSLEALHGIDPLADFLGAALRDFVEFHARDSQVLHEPGGGEVAGVLQVAVREGTEAEFPGEDV